jgi:hypothetical protein
MRLFHSRYYQITSSVILLLLTTLSLFDLFSSLSYIDQIFENDLCKKYFVLSIPISYFALFILILLFLIWFPEISMKRIRHLISFINHSIWIRLPFIFSVVITPTIIIIFTPIGLAFNSVFFKCMFLISFSLISAIALNRNKQSIIDFESVLLSVLLVVSFYIIGSEASKISNYPFSLTWSEGNRLFDYSLYFKNYNFASNKEILNPWRNPGMFMLWGLPFLIPNSPIWLHRFWDFILATIPYFILGYLLIRPKNICIKRKIIFILWTYLFLLQASIYTPLLLSASLVILLIKPKNILGSMIGVAIAGFYASSSRWTWFLAPAVWATIYLLPYLELEKKDQKFSFSKKFIPITLISISGLIGSMLANDVFLNPQKISSLTEMSHPLLWYRLFPNSTYPEGIIIALLIATLPLLAIYFWLIYRKKWHFYWYHWIPYLSAVIGFLLIGIIVSVKIGGGNNLHNLDMFFITLIIITGVSINQINVQNFLGEERITHFLLFLAIFIPSISAIKSAQLLQVPSIEQAQDSLSVLQKRISQSTKNGEVLFLDQRQLFAFGFIDNISIVQEYEKRYLMDMAMAENLDYLKNFYIDLSNNRFTMIVTDPIYTSEKTSQDTFGEENNAWVKWVAEPLLCYYKPTRVLPEVGIQLLTPRKNPKNCPDYATFK